MGVLQALESVKVLTSTSMAAEGRGEGEEEEAKPTSMLIFSAYSPQQFRNIVFRRRKKSCTTCGNDPRITLPMFLDDSVDYAALCGVVNPIHVLRGEERVEAEEYDRVRGRKEEHVLIDTRDATQFEMCHLEGSVNVPIENVRADVGSDGEARWMQHLRGGPVYLVCRLGNDSQEAVKLLKDRLESVEDEKGRIKDIRGGLRAWRERVDGEFPEY
jgi:adenylyltransferase and sulfurtransferase